MAESSSPASLLVFSDDWGRHPSSCQHLVRHLLPEVPVCWVNTIGTRRPRLDLATVRRGTEKLRDWFSREGQTESLPAGLRVLNPKMWPWFARPHDRRLNRGLLVRALRPAVAELPAPVTAVTTLPLVAPLLGHLSVDRWVYYCVDDFAAWPGLDQGTMESLERELVAKCDKVIVASEALGTRLHSFGVETTTVTHGVDLAHWQRNDNTPPVALTECSAPRVVFWGVVDRRMDAEFVLLLADKMNDEGTIVFVGPRQDPDPRLANHPRITLLDPLPYELLPSLAQAADVLIMPYIDAPVTRQMQPLKLKEYLATGRPVVVRDLPSTRPWSDCLDVADSADSFCRHVLSRIASGTSAEQTVARQRLQTESWSSKASQFVRAIQSEPRSGEGS